MRTANDTLVYIFALIYIIVDIVYVVGFHKIYKAAFYRIQKEDVQFTSPRVLAAIAAYACMALGWIVLVAPAVAQNMAKGWSAVWAGAVPGFVFGFVLYGVYNFTNYVAFQKYSPAILLQDLVWGTSWVTVISILYAYALTKK